MPILFAFFFFFLDPPSTTENPKERTIKTEKKGKKEEGNLITILLAPRIWYIPASIGSFVSSPASSNRTSGEASSSAPAADLRARILVVSEKSALSARVTLRSSERGSAAEQLFPPWSTSISRPSSSSSSPSSSAVTCASSMRACASAYVRAATERITALKNLGGGPALLPSLSTVQTQEKVSRSTPALREQISSVRAFGSMSSLRSTR